MATLFQTPALKHPKKRLFGAQSKPTLTLMIVVWGGKKYQIVSSATQLKHFKN
jgi:hypothetical protein